MCGQPLQRLVRAKRSTAPQSSRNRCSKGLLIKTAIIIKKCNHHQKQQFLNSPNPVTFASMNKNYYYKETFSNENFSEDNLDNIEFEDCQFDNCNFAALPLIQTVFDNCIFNNCNFSLAVCKKTAFRDVEFNGCKLTGMQLENAHTIGLQVSFNNCLLNQVNAYKINLKATIFTDCEIVEADFSDANLEQSKFINCNLNQTVFSNTNLQKADFRTSYNFVINPTNNKIKQAVFDKSNLEGLLVSFNIIFK